MIIESKRYIGGQEVRAGANISHPSSLGRSQISVMTVCDQVKPDQWHGEVLLFNRVVVKTASFATDGEAGRAAERTFVDNLVALLAD